MNEPADHIAGVDRLPPHSVEAEQGVLGCCLWDPNNCIPESLGVVNSETFYDLRHRTIFDATSALYESKVTVDIIAMRQHLKNEGNLDLIGGVQYLNLLQDCVPSPANLSYYLTIIKEKAMLRKVIQSCAGIVSMIYSHEGQVDEVFESVEETMVALSVMRTNPEQSTIKEIVRRVIDNIDEAHTRKGALKGIGTGFPDIDRATGGLHPTDFVVLGARTSMGKSSLGMNIVSHVSCELNEPVAVFTLEMSGEQLVERMMCADARVNMRLINDGMLVDRDFPKLTKAAGRLSNAPIYVDETGGMTLLKLRSLARQYVTRDKVKLIVIDYIQLLYWDGGQTRFSNRNEELTRIAGTLKQMAKDMNVTFLVLCQLNRDADKGGGQPQLHHLKDCGAIEEAADGIWLIYDDDPKQEPENDNQRRMLKIAKQRTGPAPCYCPLMFIKSLIKFETRSKIEDEDVPI